MKPRLIKSLTWFALIAAIVLCQAESLFGQGRRIVRGRPQTAEERLTKIRPVQYGFMHPGHRSRGYVPAHERRVTQRMHGSSEVVHGEPEIFEEVVGDVHMDISSEGEVIHEGAHPHSHAGCGSSTCATCCLIPCPIIPWDNLEIFGGVHGFTGPPNRGGTGSFGFYEGLNWGSPVPCFWNGEIGMQLGARFAHSNFNGGDFPGGLSTDSQRDQVFATGGLFRRVDWGLQGGVVVDYMHDEWYMETSLVQVRGELSWMYPCDHEIGFWFASGTQTDPFSATFGTSVISGESQSTDLYAFFYRRRFDECGTSEGRVFAGFSGESDGLIGADLIMRLTDAWALTTEYTYLIPEQSSSSVARVEESWNLAIGLVWYPSCNSARKNNYYRPLFNVAGNGTFMVDRP